MEQQKDVAQQVTDRLALLQEYIAQATNAAARPIASVRLIAVSKTVDEARVQAAFDAGQRVFGENRPQELVRKQDIWPTAEWHLIGQLQTNKVKQVVGKAALIHSVDSEKLLREISLRAAQAGVVQDCLLQANISDEDSKSGVEIEELPALVKVASQLPAVRILGLMGMAAFSDDEKLVRGQFARLRRAAESLKPYETEHIQFHELSMGMSGDFPWAIAEGATWVRVGSAIFGAR
jgi:pyridoxal phosphate enzyme (YggS family)